MMTATANTHCVNGIDLNVLQETVGAIKKDPRMGTCRFRASNRWIGAGHNCSTITTFHAAGEEIAHKQNFELHADEPSLLAGDDQGANPVEHLLNALAACVTTSMVSHAAVRGIHIDALESEVEGDIDLAGFLGLSDDVPKGYTNIRVKFKVKSDEENLAKFKSLAQFSPVYNTLLHGVNVDLEIEPK